MTPQQLMDLPYAGMAEKQLRKAGMWHDAGAFDGGAEFQVTVEVSGYYDPEIESQYFTVTAKSEDEAFDLACDLSDFDEIFDCKIEKMENLE